MAPGVTEAKTERRVDRRAYLTALASASAAGLAGCTGDDDGDGTDDSAGDDTDSGSQDQQEMGERVPSMTMEYVAGIGGFSDALGEMCQIAQENTAELGMDISVNPKDVGTLILEIYNDERNQNFGVAGFSMQPNRLDPNQFLRRTAITAAGPLENSGTTRVNWANCEFSLPALAQSEAPDPETRQELVNEAHSIASEQFPKISLMNYTVFTANRTDQVQLTADPGLASLNEVNFDLMTSDDFEFVGDTNRLIRNTTTTDVVDFPNMFKRDGPSQRTAAAFLGSPLIRYDRNFELEPYFAEDWEISNEFKTITFSLRDHVDENGNPITAEDVKWTMETLDAQSESVVRADSQPYESIEVIDDRTIEFNFTRSYPTFLTQIATKWGIVSEEAWTGRNAEEEGLVNIDLNPEDVVSTGPFRIETMSVGESVTLVPNEDHWDPASIEYQVVRYQDTQTSVRAFENGTINFMDNATASFVDRVENEGNIETHVIDGFTTTAIECQCSFGPQKFPELRRAISESLDRQRMNEVVYYGLVTTHDYSTLLGTTHPFYPENPDEVLTSAAPSAQGDVETARQTLENAGWSWDDDGNLHYPPDADLEPVYPQGDTPMDHPDKFPCVTEIQDKYQ